MFKVLQHTQSSTAQTRPNSAQASLLPELNVNKRSIITTAILLSVGLTIGVIVDSLTSGLKSVAKVVENGLKDLGKKVGQILPGLIGTFVSFIFRTAGSVIGFLGKNSWFLILGVVIFAVEKFQKKNR